MTEPLDAVPEPDDRPVAVIPAAAPAPVRRRGGSLLTGWLLATLVLLVACIVCLSIGLSGTDVLPLHIVIDGDDLSDGISISGVSGGMAVLLAVGIVLLAFALLLLVPVVLLLVLGAVGLALVCGLGLPLVALVLAIAAVSSPLWLVGLLVWLAVRRRPAPPVTMQA
ncbi:MAG TPA: hypothetical protein VIP05_09480 [Burkholderiaceae bacterium]